MLWCVPPGAKAHSEVFFGGRRVFYSVFVVEAQFSVALRFFTDLTITTVITTAVTAAVNARTTYKAMGADSISGGFPHIYAAKKEG